MLSSRQDQRGSTVLLYSLLCPCEACAAAICQCSTELGIKVTVVYEREWSPAEYSQLSSDAVVIKSMKDAGIEVQRLMFKDVDTDHEERVNACDECSDNALPHTPEGCLAAVTTTD